MFSAPALVAAGVVLVITVAGWGQLESVVGGGIVPTPESAVASEPASAPPEAPVQDRVIPAEPVVTASPPPRSEQAAPAVVAEATPPMASPPAAATRYTKTWVNVRTAPGTDAPVALVLDPGEQIEVGENRRGWWLVYLQGRPIGYAANSVLDVSPPSVEPFTN